MRALSEALTDLIALAEHVVTRPRSAEPIASIERLSLLAGEVRKADALPAEGERTTRAAVVMVIALEEFCGGGRPAGSPWLMLAGTTLPLLRTEAWLAMRNERSL
jgi:hypothetical protein